MLLDIVHHRFHVVGRRRENHVELLGKKTFAFAQADDVLDSDMVVLLVVGGWVRPNLSRVDLISY